MINPKVVERYFRSPPNRYDQDNVIFYALSIGAGISDLDYIYEKHLKVYPTFVVVPLLPTLMEVIREAGVNLQTLLHAEQRVDIIKPIPVNGAFIVEAQCDSVFDKGDHGAILNISSRGYLENNSELIFQQHTVLMDKSGGNFGGEKGPKAKSLDISDLGTPDRIIAYHTPDNLAALYRLNGDKNPLHIDPEFASRAGFKKPILHGLCTLGIATRLIIKESRDSVPTQLISARARFASAVTPGDTVRLEVWDITRKKSNFQMTNQAGDVVLSNGVFEFS